MTIIVGMNKNNVKIIIFLTKPISCLKQKKQPMDSCVILKIHYSCELALVMFMNIYTFHNFFGCLHQ